jgi:hypothetical protein
LEEYCLFNPPPSIPPTRGGNRNFNYLGFLDNQVILEKAGVKRPAENPWNDGILE